MTKVALRVYNRDIENLIDQGQTDEAVAHCMHILKSFPKHLETYRLMGKAYLEAHRYAEAADIFMRVLLAVPDDFVSHLGMSIVNDEKRDLSGAIWHMERAFEINSTNSGIQSELRRLYGRRDGVEPGRIHLTRGALAHIYTKAGEYQQAISEIKAVLAEDNTRNDMKTLLARAYFGAGSKNEAVETCTELLKMYPYSLDANRILVDILPGTSMAQNLEQYQRRIRSLDPYAANVTGSVFNTPAVPDNAVMIDQLDWDPNQAYQKPAAPAAPATPAQAQPAGEIPAWMKQSGWEPSSGESAPETATSEAPNEPAEPASGPLAAAEIPDWLKAMAPPAAADNLAEQAAASDNTKGAEEEADFEWLAGLGAPQEATPSQTQTTAAQEISSPEPKVVENNPAPAGDLAWLNEITPNAGAAAPAADENLDWLNAVSPAGEIKPEAEEPATELPDWLKGMADEPARIETASTAFNATEEIPDWLKELSGAASKAEIPQAEVTSQAAAEAPETSPEKPVSAPFTSPVTSAAEQDEALAWLKSLAAKQSAQPEELMTPTAEQTESAPAAITSEPAVEPAAKAPALEETPAAKAPTLEAPAPEVAPAVEEPLSALVSGSGTSASEQDEALAWLESLAAKQGAQPEELITPTAGRTETVPSWVTGQPAAEPAAEVPSLEAPAPEEAPAAAEAPKLEAPEAAPAVEEPLSALISGPGTSAAEQDEAMAWLESLAAKQGAKPEELITPTAGRTETVPSWVTSQPAAEPAAEAPAPEETPAAEMPAVEALPAAEAPAVEAPAPEVAPAVEEPLSALVSGPGTSAAEQDEALAWLESLAVKQGAKPEELITPTTERTESVPSWVTGQPAVEPAAEAPAPEEPPAVERITTEPPAPEETLAAETPAVEALSATEAPTLEAPAPEVAPFVEEPLSALVSGPGTSAAEQDEALAWLESLAVKQGAKPEELITPTTERTESVPSWVTGQPAAEPAAEAPAPEEPPAVERITTEAPAPEETSAVGAPPLEAPAPEAAPAVEEPLSALVTGPGTSASEQDEAMAWLESLAAKQGAKPEELITPTAERTEAVPAWVSGQPAAEPASEAPALEETPIVETPSLEAPAIEEAAPTAEVAPVESPPVTQLAVEAVPPTEEPFSALVTGPGTSATEQDEAMAWLESLAAKQGARPEELITPTAERTEAVPAWVTGQPAAEPAAEAPAPEETPAVEAPTLEAPAPEAAPTAEVPVTETSSELPLRAASGRSTQTPEQMADTKPIRVVKIPQTEQVPPIQAEAVPEKVEPAQPLPQPDLAYAETFASREDFDWLGDLSKPQEPEPSKPAEPITPSQPATRPASTNLPDAPEVSLEWLTGISRQAPPKTVPPAVPAAATAESLAAEAPSSETPPAEILENRVSEAETPGMKDSEAIKSAQESEQTSDWFASLMQAQGSTPLVPLPWEQETPAAQPVEAQPEPIPSEPEQAVPGSSKLDETATEANAPLSWKPAALEAGTGETQADNTLKESPDWLARLDEAASESISPLPWEPAAPEAGTSETASAADIEDETPDWLAGLDEATPEALSAQRWEQSALEPDSGESLPGANELDETPDWLAGLDEAAPETIVPLQWEPASVEPGSVETPPASKLQADNADWLASLMEPASESTSPLPWEPATPPVASAESTPTENLQAETDDWLASLTKSEQEPATPAEQEAAQLETPASDLIPASAHAEAADEDITAWLASLDETEPEASLPQIPETTVPAAELPMEASTSGETKSIESMPWEEVTQPEEVPAQPQPKSDISEWLQGLQDRDEEPFESEKSIPWLNPISAPLQPKASEMDELPDWLKDPTVDEPVIEKTTQPAEPEPVQKITPAAPAQVNAPVPTPETPSVAQPVQPVVPARALPGSAAPAIQKGPSDIERARDLLAHASLAEAMKEYSRLIRKGRQLEEVIHDLQDSVYKHPVDMVIWQTLGDAYFRANRLQEALDAYGKAEGLLR